MLIHKFTVFLIVAFIVSNSFSQHYSFKNYNVSNGMPSSEVYDVIQASDHTLWMATFKGVSNFDGKTFRNYTTDDGLTSNIIRTVYEDSRGRIWVGFWRKGMTYIEDGEVKAFTDRNLTKGNVIQFLESKDGAIWIFKTNMIIRFKEGVFETMYVNKDRKDYAYPNGVIETQDGAIWVATLGRGLIKITQEPFDIEVLNNDSHGINNINYSLFEDEQGAIWVGSYGVLYKGTNGSWEEISLGKESDKNRVWSIVKERDKLWLGLYGNGIATYSEKSGVSFLNSDNGLTDNYCYKLILDKEGNKWMATENSGIVRFRDYSFSHFTKTQGMQDAIVNDIVQLDDESLAIASPKGISKFTNGRVQRYAMDGEFVFSMNVASDGKLWYVGQKEYGVIDGERYVIDDEVHYTVATGSEGDAFIAGNKGVATIDDKGHRFKRVINLNARASVVLENQCFFGTDRGIFEFHLGNLKRIPNLPDDLFSVQSATACGEDAGFFGSNDYLVYVKKLDTTYMTKVFPKKRFDGLSGFNSLAVKGNDLWIGSSNGLGKLNISYLLEKDSIRLKVYNKDLGFIKSEPTDNAIVVNSKDEVFVGTSSGMVQFSSSEFRENSIPPVLRMNSVLLFSEEFSDSLYRQNGAVTFPYDKNHITFNYAAVSHTYPENVHYKYRLRGLPNSEWSSPTQERKVMYPYLPSGSYVFEFIADNGFGVWQEKAETYPFIITAPFWKKDGFKAMVVLGLVGLILLWMFFRQQSHKRSHKRYTLALLSAQEMERKRISKELHDGIGQDLLFIKNSLALEKDVTPDMVDKTIEDVRTMSRNLHPAELEKFGLTKAIANMVAVVSKVTTIYFTEELDDIDQSIPKEKEIYIYRIIQECINNIIKHSEATASRITVVDEESEVKITIQDNGIGFNPQKTKETTNSLGLRSLMERVEYLNGKIVFNSTLGKGTIVEITLNKL